MAVVVVTVAAASAVRLKRRYHRCGWETRGPRIMISYVIFQTWHSKWQDGCEWLLCQGSLSSLVSTGAHFSKNWIHISHKISQFTFHKSLFQKCVTSFHISQITFLISHFLHTWFTTSASYFVFYTHIFKCEMWSVICEVRNENHISHFTDPKCDLWNKHEMWFQIFEKSAPGPCQSILSSVGQKTR